jgi:response regulator RpfG family c-di-GMP phosphodiesterase
MPNKLDIIIVDDEPSACRIVTKMVKKYYVWGDIFSFINVDEAIEYCLNREIGVAIFIVDVFLREKSGFDFLDAIEKKFLSARDDTIIITAHASNDVVNMCLASEVNFLLEKPIRPHALQFAVRAITTKYLKFAKKLLQDSVFAKSVAGF